MSTKGRKAVAAEKTAAVMKNKNDFLHIRTGTKSGGAILLSKKNTYFPESKKSM